MEGNKEFINKIKDLSGSELNEAVRDEKRNQIIDLVCRQTNYTREEAEENLKKHKGNYINVVKEYLNPTEKSETIKTPAKSTNQRIYGEIRGFMDKAAKNYELQKERNEYIQKQREKILMKQQKENEKVEISEVNKNKNKNQIDKSD